MAAIAIGIVVTLMVFLVAFGVWLYRRYARKNFWSIYMMRGKQRVEVNDFENPANANVIPRTLPPHGPHVKDHTLTTESFQYQLKTLKLATKNFSKDHMIGRGGFGLVYKGTLANGQDIAVKRLSENSGQGDKEFNAEVELLTKLRHRNLVSLLGCCMAGGEMLLVYEFVKNKSLDYFLFDPLQKVQLNWSMRYNIIKGTARGMSYLHEDAPTRIIHRDLKVANVLLDGDMNPKIADFGLARISNFEQTHISMSRVAGTYGYMAPEYLMYGKMSVKSDVYSFGVLLLEIISGKKINAPANKSIVGENLLIYAWRCWEEKTPLAVMDPTIKDTCIEEEALKCINIGLLCTQEDFNKRPTMAKIIHIIDSDSDSALPSIPQRPAFMSGVFGDQTTTTTMTVTTSSNSGSAPWTYGNDSK